MAVIVTLERVRHDQRSWLLALVGEYPHTPPPLASFLAIL